MKLKVFEYSSCDTCRKATKFLDQKKILYERVPIVENPPTIAELKRMLKFVEADGGSIKNLFNVSGQVYRELGVAEKLKAGMSDDEAIQLLAKNGKLIKRPFAIAADRGVVGFKEEVWAKAWKL